PRTGKPGADLGAARAGDGVAEPAHAVAGPPGSGDAARADDVRFSRESPRPPGRACDAAGGGGEVGCGLSLEDAGAFLPRVAGDAGGAAAEGGGRGVAGGHRALPAAGELGNRGAVPGPDPAGGTGGA